MCSSYIGLTLGTARQRGKHGNPGNLRIRTSTMEASGHWVNHLNIDVKGSTTSLPNINIDLRSGEVCLCAFDLSFKCLSHTRFVMTISSTS